MLLLLHRGRKSGAERFVVVEAVDREDPNTVLIASGFGTNSQWYQNRMVGRSCLVLSIGFRKPVPATAELLDASVSELIASPTVSGRASQA